MNYRAENLLCAPRITGSAWHANYVVDLNVLRLTALQTQHAKNVQYLLKQVETVSTNPVLERLVQQAIPTCKILNKGLGFISRLSKGL